MNGMEGLRRKMDPVPAGRCLLGVSGGADSVALLVLLAGEGAPADIRPEAVHVNQDRKSVV